MLTLTGYVALSDDPLIKCFIKAVHHLRPPKSKYSSTWYADIFLRHWKQIENNSLLNLLELSKKIIALLVLLHGLRISTIGTFDMNLINILNDTCICYACEPLKLDQQGRPRDEIIYKKFENSKLCSMSATNEYLEHRAEPKISYIKFLLTAVTPYGPPHKDTVARWVKNSLTKARVNTNFFHHIVADHLSTVKLITLA